MYKTNDLLNMDNEKSLNNPLKMDTVEHVELTRENIEKLKDDIYLVDSDKENDLDMFCYLKCDNNSPDIIKNSRGIVFNKDNVVMSAFPYTYEYTNTEESLLSVFADMNDWSVYPAYEGTLLRMFYFNNKWYLSTHKKLDAFKSKWSSKDSFGELFIKSLHTEEQNNVFLKNCLPKGDDIFERFKSILDKNNQYMFLIRSNNENRIVCKNPEMQRMYHVGTFTKDGLSFSDNINISKPDKLNITNVNELIQCVSKSNINFIQGIIAFNIKKNIHVKIYNNTYYDYFKVRGNEQSIRFRYLQVRLNKDYTNKLVSLYPNYKNEFVLYEQYIKEISKNIYTAYVNRFIKKLYVVVPKEEYVVMKECHSWHLANRDVNKISLDKVFYKLNSQPATKLNKMIKNFKLLNKVNTLY